MSPVHASDFFVSPKGSDTNPGTREEPFWSPARAQQAAREAVKRAGGPVTITFRGGSYPLKEPLVFAPEDSGQPGAPVIYTSYPGESALLSGGQTINGPWTKVDGKPYYVTQVPKLDRAPWVFNRLYVNGKSRPRARTPNGLRVLEGTKEFDTSAANPKLSFRAGDLDPEWEHLTDIDVVLPLRWTGVHHRIESVDFANRELPLVSAGGMHQRRNDPSPRYYLANVFAGLDAPGEWFLNREAEKLFYVPKPGEDMDNIEVIAPVLSSRLITFEGDPIHGELVSHLEFRNLAFKYTDTDRDKWDGVYQQAHAFLDAAIFARGLTHARFVGCEIASTGEYGLEFVEGCQDNTIERCHFYDLGGGGIQVGISDRRKLLDLREAAGPGAVDPQGDYRTDVLRNTVRNSRIHDTGTYWMAAYAMNIRLSAYTGFLHNEVYDTHYTGLAVDARFYPWRRFEGDFEAHSNEIAYNHFYNIGQGFFSDGAAIYQFGPTDNHIHHNLIHDVVDPHNNDMHGVYFDQQSTNALAEFNLIYKIAGSGLKQHWGYDNTFRNNIVAFCREGGATHGYGGSWEDYPDSNVAIIRNVFISRDGKGFGSKWPPSKGDNVIRDNLFYDTNHSSVTMMGEPWEDWITRSGYSSILGDPGAADPAGLDFTISETNADLKAIGFELFAEEIAKAGVLSGVARRAKTEERKWEPTHAGDAASDGLK